MGGTSRRSTEQLNVPRKLSHRVCVYISMGNDKVFTCCHCSAFFLIYYN